MQMVNRIKKLQHVTQLQKIACVIFLLSAPFPVEDRSNYGCLPLTSQGLNLVKNRERKREMDILFARVINPLPPLDKNCNSILLQSQC